MTTFSGRLKEERKRVKLTQTELALNAGITKSAQVDYEKERLPAFATYLEKVAEAGLDVGYIVTGQRGPVPLTPEETALLELYRAAGPALRAAALAVLGTGSAGGVQISGSGNNVVAAGGSTVRITGAAPKPRRGKDV